MATETNEQAPATPQRTLPPHIQMAQAAYDRARARLDALLAQEQAGIPAEYPTVWLFAALASESATVLANYWTDEAEQLQSLAIDHLG